jgi:hypothetical protein
VVGTGTFEGFWNSVADGHMTNFKSRCKEFCDAFVRTPAGSGKIFRQN